MEDFQETWTTYSRGILGKVQATHSLSNVPKIKTILSAQIGDHGGIDAADLAIAKVELIKTKSVLLLGYLLGRYVVIPGKWTVSRDTVQDSFVVWEKVNKNFDELTCKFRVTLKVLINFHCLHYVLHVLNVSNQKITTSKSKSNCKFFQ